MNRTIFIWFITVMMGISIDDVSGQELYSVNSLPFNSRDYDDFAAVPYKDGLVFCSNRPQNVFIVHTNPDGQPLLDLYFTRKKATQKWSAPELLPGNINSRFYEGPMSFSKDQKTIFFTRGTVDSEDIFSSNFDGSAWSPPSPFQFNEAMTAQPFLSEDGKKFFFASDRKGGFGGFDIYLCTLGKNNKWSRPKNLGSAINSASDEKYPFLQKDGRLYFSSNRKSGIGGYDIYFSEQTKAGGWSKPVLLPPPINSVKNEIAFTADSLDRHGYLSSDRNNNHQLLDIFEYNLNFPEFDHKNVLPQKKNKYTYIFTENNAFGTDTTGFLYEWDFGDGQKTRGRNLQVEHTFQTTGDYMVQLNVIDTATGQVLLNQAANIFPVRDIEQPFIDSPDTATVNEALMMNAEKTFLPNTNILNYYWDFQDGVLAIGKVINHSFKEAGTYKVILAVTYTDRSNRIQVDTRFKQIVIIKNP